MKRWLGVFGTVYLCLATIVIAFGYGATWYFQGFWAMTAMMNPFNLIGWIAVVATLLPGFVLLHLGRS